jgi:CysZ protein
MFTALGRAFGQLSDPPVARVVGRSVLASLVALVALVILLSWAISGTDWFAADWLNGLTTLAGTLGAVVLAWFLFPAVVLAVSGLFLDQVVAAVERRWYPGRPPSRPVPLATDLGSSLGMAGLVVVLNLLALPFYLLLPAGTVLLYYALNGYLLGRQYFELVALRHVGPDAARRLRVWVGMKLFWAGATFAFLSSIPLVNLLVPVIATATMVHLFEAAALERSKGLLADGGP